MALPLVGAQVALIGWQAFNVQARSVEATVNSLVRSSYYLERESARSFANIAKSSSLGMAAIKAAAAGAVVAAAAVATAVAAAAAAAAKAAALYNQEVAFIGAVSQASSTDVAVLSDAQLELARRSTTTAVELAKVSQELVKAGVSIKDVTGDALEAVNNLVVASKGELEAARAATLVQVSMKGFGVSAARAADIATGAVQTSTITFNEYSDAIRQGGGVLSGAGVQLEEFGALVSVVGQQIKSGTEIGTGLRVMWQRLAAPQGEAIKQMKEHKISLYDVNGAARPVVDVIGDLTDRFSAGAVASGKITQQQRDYAVAQIFGTRSSKILNALTDEGTEGYLRQLEAVQNLKAADLAGEVLIPSAAQAKILRQQIEILGIAFGQGLDPLVQDATTSLNNFLRQTQRTDDVRNFSTALSDTMFNAFGDVSVAVGGSIDYFSKFFKSLGALERAVVYFFQAVYDAAVQFSYNLGKVVGGVINHLVDMDSAARKGIFGIRDLHREASEFLSDIPNLAAEAGGAVSQLGRDLDVVDFNLGEDLRKVDFAIPDKPLPRDYAGDARRRVAAVAAEIDAAHALTAARKGSSERPDSDTEPGFLPDDDELKKAADKIADILKRLLEIEKDFNDDLREESKRTAKALEEAYTDAFESINEASLKKEQDVTKAMQDAGDRERELFDERALDEATEARREALDTQLDDAARTRTLLLEDAGVTHQRSLEDEDLFQRSMRKIRQDAFDRGQQDAARQRAEKREDEDRVYQDTARDEEANLDRQQKLDENSLKQEQERRERALNTELDAEERALKQQQDLRERALAARIADEEAALEASQRLRERELEAVFDQEKLAHEAAQARAGIAAEQAADIAEAQAEYNKQLSIGVKASIAQGRLRDALAKIDKKTAEDTAKLTGRETLAGEDRTLAQSQAARKAALDATFAAEELTLEQSAQQRKDTLAAEFYAEDLRLQLAHNDKKLALDATHEQAVSDLHTEQERTRDALSDRLDREARERSHAREREDREFAEEQERYKNINNAKEDARALSEGRKRDDDERTLKRAADVKDREFQELQRKTRQTLDKQLDQEDFNRTIENLHKERDERIGAAETALAEEQKKTRRKLAEDLADLRGNLDDKIDSIRTRYIDRLDDVMTDAEGKLVPVFDRITSHIAEQLENLRDTARETASALSDALGVKGGTVAPAANGESDQHAERNAYFNNAYSHYKNQGFTDDEASTLAHNESVDRYGYQYGGTVPGRFGAKVPIMAHGGERFEGIGAYNTALTAVRTAEAMLGRQAQSGSTTTNNYSYNVDAQYGRVQPEGSVARDMSALVTLTRS